MVGYGSQEASILFYIFLRLDGLLRVYGNNVFVFQFEQEDDMWTFFSIMIQLSPLHQREHINKLRMIHCFALIHLLDLPDEEFYLFVFCEDIAVEEGVFLLALNFHEHLLVVALQNLDPILNNIKEFVLGSCCSPAINHVFWDQGILPLLFSLQFLQLCCSFQYD